MLAGVRLHVHPPPRGATAVVGPCLPTACERLPNRAPFLLFPLVDANYDQLMLGQKCGGSVSCMLWSSMRIHIGALKHLCLSVHRPGLRLGLGEGTCTRGAWAVLNTSRGG